MNNKRKTLCVVQAEEEKEFVAAAPEEDETLVH